MGFTFPVRARHPAIRLLYDYWRSKCAGGCIPGRNRFDPAEMKPFLRHVVMLDVERYARQYRFRYRLVGTHVVEFFGRDMTGLFIDGTRSAEEWFPTYDWLVGIVERQEPAYSLSDPTVPEREFLTYEHLTVPLSSDGRIVDLLFAVWCAPWG